MRVTLAECGSFQHMILLSHLTPCLLISYPIIWKDYNFWSCFHWSVHVCSTGMFNFACWMQWSKRWRGQRWWFCCRFPFRRCNIWNTWLYFCSTGNFGIVSWYQLDFWFHNTDLLVRHGKHCCLLFLTLRVKEFRWVCVRPY